MSSNSDGGNSDDAFCSISASAEVLQLLSQHAAGGGGSAASAAGLGGVALPPQLLWPNQLLGTQYMHPQQQQQAHFNEFLFNMHPHAYAAPPGQPETYSVLPMGHGNFLKVYHCTEGTASGLTTDGAYHHHHQPQHQFQQPQHQFHHHHMQPPQPPPPPAQQQQQAQPPIFNSYELFSSSTQILPTPDHAPDMPTPKSQPQIQPQVQPAPLVLLNNHGKNIQNDITPEPTQTQVQAHGQVNTTTNMIINKLVNNWSPNVTGGTYSQFGSALPQMIPTQAAISSEGQMAAQPTLPELNNINNNNTISGGNNNNLLAAQVTLINSESSHNVQSTLQQQTQPPQPNMTVLPIVKQPKTDLSTATTTSSINYREPTLCVSATATVSANASAADAASTSAVPLNTPTLPEVKKRIVAEVKPMRMTYSDVLSKFNNQQAALAQTSTKQNGSGKNCKPMANATQLLSERKAENKNGAESLANGATRRLANAEEANGSMRLNKKSPTHENKENVQQQTSVINASKTKRNNNSNSATTNNNNVSAGNSNSNGQPKHTQKSNARAGINDINNSNSNNNNNNNKKRNSTNNRRTEDVPPAECNKKLGGGMPTEKNFNAYYNVTAKHNSNDSYERATKTNNNNNNVNAAANSVHNTNSRKASSNGNNNPNSNSNKSSSAYYSNASASYAPNQQRTRYSNSLSNASSYSYSSKRQRGNNTSSSAAAAAATNHNYELAKKLLRTWCEYTLKILTWLFYLFYDIVVLGFSMVYERILHAYVCGLCYAKQLRRELQQNSNKPGLWLKNYWRRFDARFKKNSHWAFWRRFYKKKPPETPTENFKSGRLPQTGEEAMYSLLNCKGKDAYSILGVPPDSSQEQIRKHYKKIAVLVHPDKNKQAGAEEAFKVLQRAFELIGEPENRLAYDQSLAEALHAEKAWTELHDLLSQLQTKITEAANTIRCSTCSLRHPRKVTDRPHYAARECASCKIRHSAREGDIWAETSFMGLRWKYLALMDGKVYDITEWANCQKGALSHLEPNSHMVQYRIVRGAQQQQQQQQQHQHAQQQQPQQAHQQHHSPHHGQQYQNPHGLNAHHERVGSGNKFKRDMPPSEASLHDFLDNLYGGQHPSQAANSARRRTRRN